MTPIPDPQVVLTRADRAWCRKGADEPAAADYLAMLATAVQTQILDPLAEFTADDVDMVAGLRADLDAAHKFIAVQSEHLLAARAGLENAITARRTAEDAPTAHAAEPEPAEDVAHLCRYDLDERRRPLPCGVCERVHPWIALALRRGDQAAADAPVVPGV